MTKFTNTDLTKKAKAHKEKAERKWLQENRKAIESRNRFVAKHGLFSNGLRTF